MFTINEFTTAIQKTFFTFTYNVTHSNADTVASSSHYYSFYSYENETSLSARGTSYSTYQSIGFYTQSSSSYTTRGDSSSTFYVAGYSFRRSEALGNANGDGYSVTKDTVHITDTFWPSDNNRIFDSSQGSYFIKNNQLLVDIGIKNKQTSISYYLIYTSDNYFLSSHNWLVFNGLGGYTLIPDSVIAGGSDGILSTSASYITDGGNFFTYASQNGTTSSSSSALGGNIAGVFLLRSTAGYTYSSNGIWSFYATSNETILYEGTSAVTPVNYLRTSSFITDNFTFNYVTQVTTQFFTRVINGLTTQYSFLTIDTLTTTMSLMDSSTGESSILSYLNNYYNNSAAGLGYDKISVISAASSEILYYYKVPDSYIGPVEFNLSNYIITDKVSLICSYSQLFIKNFVNYSNTYVPTLVNIDSSSQVTFNIQFTSTSLKNTSLTFCIYNGNDQGISFPLSVDSYRNTFYYTYNLTRTLTTYINSNINVSTIYQTTSITVWDYSLNNLSIYNVDNDDQISILNYNNYYPVTRTVSTTTAFVNLGQDISFLNYYNFLDMGGTFRVEKGAASTSHFSSTFLESFPYRVFGYRDFVNNNYQAEPKLLNNKWFPFPARVAKISSQTMFVPYFGTYTTHYVVNSTNNSTTSFAVSASKTVSIDGRSIYATTKHTRTIGATSITEQVSYTDSYVYLENDAIEPYKVTVKAVEQNNNLSSFYYTGTNKSKLDSIIYNMFGFARFYDLTNGELATTSIFETIAISYSSDLSTKFLDIKPITYINLSNFNYSSPAFGVYYYFSTNKTFNVDFLG